MTLPLDPELPPVRVDDTGTARVGPSRVLLETVVAAFWDGTTPEQLAQACDGLRLADVYAAVGYYLRHRAAVDAYLAARTREAAELRGKVEAAQRDLPDIRSRLLAARAARGAAPAERAPSPV